MTIFEEAMEELLEDEGVYSNDPLDPGGETYMGIARRFHPNWPGWKIIDATPKHKLDTVKDELKSHVNSLYKKEYWDRIKGDELAEINGHITTEVFNCGVNIGCNKAAYMLQSGINVLNVNGALYPDIKEDGRIGPVTVMMFKKCIEKGNPNMLMNAFVGQWISYYINIYKENPAKERFRGWLNRIEIYMK